MTEAEKQRARVDALIVWVEEQIELLNYYGVGALAADQLIFPDPHRTADAPESTPRRDRNSRNTAAALAFLENDK
ncbi:hypothetical protein [Streptomyces sp. BPTC-684]|uniref:hypothetical protein n=1 Tax=Streptomyces sp. BPTC-684 TaxID=3043734 RepID=UPI0024B1AF83|nr:hypothetical protein [Streptomyces sp. BPTC-684]WHM38852.1 hypothetical protein QIY60_19310 [Streptomyces sp. BPTC-684]